MPPGWPFSVLSVSCMKTRVLTLCKLFPIESLSPWVRKCQCFAEMTPNPLGFGHAVETSAGVRPGGAAGAWGVCRPVPKTSACPRESGGGIILEIIIPQEGRGWFIWLPAFFCFLV